MKFFLQLRFSLPETSGFFSEDTTLKYGCASNYDGSVSILSLSKAKPTSVTFFVSLYVLAGGADELTVNDTGQVFFICTHIRRSLRKFLLCGTTMPETDVGNMAVEIEFSILFILKFTQYKVRNPLKAESYP